MSGVRVEGNACPFSVTCTAGRNYTYYGGKFGWLFPVEPNTYPGGDWYLEASISVSDTKGISTCTLVATEIGSVRQRNDINNSPK